MITAQDIDIVDLPWLEQRGFRARPEVRSTLRYNARTKTYPVYVTVTRASDRGIIDIHYEETDRRDRMEGKPRVSAMIGDYTPPVASGFPLGVDQYLSASISIGSSRTQRLTNTSRPDTATWASPTATVAASPRRGVA